MSSHFEKPADENPEIISKKCLDKANRDRFNAMDDEDIVFNDDSPEIPRGFWQGAHVTVQGRPATPVEIEDLRRRVLAYINRPRQT